VPRPLYETQICSLGWKKDADAQRLIRLALRDAWPAAVRFGWRAKAIVELDPESRDVGYSGKDGTIFLKVRDPARRGQFYGYSFLLATLLHELTHISHLGHGKPFYRQLLQAVAASGAQPAARREVHQHVGAELLNAVCDNDQRRAKALLAVIPEAVHCCRPGGQTPLEYAAHHGRVALTRILLDARADIGAGEREAEATPLERAMARGNAKTARLLLEARASAEALDRQAGGHSGQALDVATREDRSGEVSLCMDCPSGTALSVSAQRRGEALRMARRAESLPLLTRRPASPVNFKSLAFQIALSGPIAL